jgi:hypothetical protein
MLALRRWEDVVRRGEIAGVAFQRRLARRKIPALLAASGIVVALAFAELGLRAYTWVRTARELARMANDSAPELIDTRFGQLGPGVRLSRFPDVGYELRPNLRGRYDGKKYRSNRFGFRQDDDPALEKPEGVARIVGIGDSWMWGMGVDDGETYLDRLRERFSAAARPVQVLNTAVWGYDARQQVATLRWKGLAFHPDIVVIGLCGNDREYPSFLRQRPVADLGRSYLWNEVAGRLGFAATSAERGESMPFAKFLGAYAELAELAERGGFEVVVFSECFAREGPERQHRSCRLGTDEEWRTFVEHLRGWHFRTCPWDIGRIPQNFPYYGHATVEGNRMLAGVLAECLEPLLAARGR